MADKQLELGEDDGFLALQRAWEAALAALAECMDKPSFESWVKPAKPLSMEDGVATIGTTSRFAKKWLESKHLSRLQEILEAQLGTRVSVRIQIIEGPEPPIMTERLPPRPTRSSDRTESISQPLNQSYTFDNFVVGPNNRLAQACALAVADKPGGTYNPLFLYGGPGLGKTHLLHAMGLRLTENFPDKRVVYVSGETFTYHYISSLRDHSTSEFRRRYRSVDVWLVDDIHFLAGKERTEEEFFHTFNAIYDTGRQIVLSSDRPPKELPLASRLLSRFECGMVADISPPDFETRIAILQNKALVEGVTLPQDVFEYIARLVTSNVRQLEGALIKLHAYASLMKADVTTELAQQVLGDYFKDLQPPPIDPAGVLLEVAREFKVEVTDIKGSCRRRDIVVPRQVAMYLARELTDASLPSIGRAFGGRDHSTVLHACKTVKQRMQKDKPFASRIHQLANSIRNGRR